VSCIILPLDIRHGRRGDIHLHDLADEPIPILAPQDGARTHPDAGPVSPTVRSK
jgi:hypothetical protein